MTDGLAGSDAADGGATDGRDAVHEPGDRARPRRILLALESFSEYQRRIIAGVAHYVTQHNCQWEFLFRQVPATVIRDASLLSRIAEADGTITYAVPGQPDVAARLPEARGPVIFVEQPTRDHPTVLADNAAIGRMAFEHLRSKGLRRFAYFTTYPVWPFTERQQAFEEAVRAAGLSVCPGVERTSMLPAAEATAALELWLRGLPKPVAVFTGNADMCRAVSTQCRRAGIRVPEEVAVLGVDHDMLMCSLAWPTLSTIDHNMEGVGYAAAGLLARALEGEALPDAPVIVPPVGVIERQSTDTLAVEDKDVAEALRFIRLNACRGLTCGEVLHHVPVARRTLETAFRRHLGRTMLQEIRRVQIEQAKKLFRETDLTIAQVASHCGFSYGTRLSAVFRKVTGQTVRSFARSAAGDGSSARTE